MNTLLTCASDTHQPPHDFSFVTSSVVLGSGSESVWCICMAQGSKSGSVMKYLQPHPEVMLIESRLYLCASLTYPPYAFPACSVPADSPSVRLCRDLFISSRLQCCQLPYRTVYKTSTTVTAASSTTSPSLFLFHSSCAPWDFTVIFSYYQHQHYSPLLHLTHSYKRLAKLERKV